MAKVPLGFQTSCNEGTSVLSFFLFIVFQSEKTVKFFSMQWPIFLIIYQCVERSCFHIQHKHVRTLGILQYDFKAAFAIKFSEIK